MSTANQPNGLKVKGIRRLNGLLLGLSLFSFMSGCTTEESGAEASVEVIRTVEARRQKLLGRWLRQDGGYMLEIRRVRSSGQVEAAYFNPRPINVKTAEVRQSGEELRVYVELQDVGYPGSYYDLLYDANQDTLTGNYFQATQKATYAVFFVRNPAP
jgi:hypothetical protein